MRSVAYFLFAAQLFGKTNKNVRHFAGRIGNNPKVAGTNCHPITLPAAYFSFAQPSLFLNMMLSVNSPILGNPVKLNIYLFTKQQRGWQPDISLDKS